MMRRFVAIVALLLAPVRSIGADQCVCVAEPAWLAHDHDRVEAIAPYAKTINRLADGAVQAGDLTVVRMMARYLRDEIKFHAAAMAVPPEGDR